MRRSCRFTFCEREGLVEGKDYRTLRFNSDVGKHGDTGTSEVDVVRAVLDGRADAGAIGSPFWKTVRSRASGAGRRAAPRSGPRRPTITACSRRGPISTPRWSRQFAEALFGMSYDNPTHRPVLEAEGLRRWVAPQLDGYAELRDASARQGFLKRRLVEPESAQRASRTAVVRRN